MSSRFLNFIAVVLAAAATPLAAAKPSELRVCADPDNLPFSNRHSEGFENRIAEVLARELGAKLRYVWQRTGRGFVRTYLNKGECDALIGMPVGSPPDAHDDTVLPVDFRVRDSP